MKPDWYTHEPGRTIAVAGWEASPHAWWRLRPGMYGLVDPGPPSCPDHGMLRGGVRGVRTELTLDAPPVGLLPTEVVL